MAVQIHTSDSRVWHAFQLGYATRPSEWFIAAACDDEQQLRMFSSDRPLHDISSEVLVAKVETADAFAPETLEQWEVRPPAQFIAPPARHFTPGSAELTGIGVAEPGATVSLRLKSSGQRVSMKVVTEHPAGLFSGVVEDVESGDIAAASMIGRTYGFHQQHVFAVESDAS